LFCGLFLFLSSLKTASKFPYSEEVLTVTGEQKEKARAATIWLQAESQELCGHDAVSDEESADFQEQDRPDGKYIVMPGGERCIYQKKDYRKWNMWISGMWNWTHWWISVGLTLT
jgi:hypothetical protein